MLAYSQILVVAACTIGLVLFVFVNYFVIRRLQADDRRNRMAMNQPIVAVVAEVVPNRSPEDIEREKELALFYMHQEQVRRLVDAKIEVIKDSSRTNNQIAIIQAEVAKIHAEKEVRLIESGVIPTEPKMLAIEHDRLIEVEEDQHGELVVQDRDGANPWGQRVPDEFLGSLARQQRAVRNESERQLAELEEQMQGLPGRSMGGWVKSQLDSTRD